MANANVNKVIYGDQTLIDLTNDTVTPNTLFEGVTAHNAAGNLIVGAYNPNAYEVSSKFVTFTESFLNSVMTATRNGNIVTLTGDIRASSVPASVTIVTGSRVIDPTFLPIRRLVVPVLDYNTGKIINGSLWIESNAVNYYGEALTNAHFVFSTTYLRYQA